MARLSKSLTCAAAGNKKEKKELKEKKGKKEKKERKGRKGRKKKREKHNDVSSSSSSDDEKKKEKKERKERYDADQDLQVQAGTGAGTVHSAFGGTIRRSHSCALTRCTLVRDKLHRSAITIYSH